MLRPDASLVAREGWLLFALAPAAVRNPHPRPSIFDDDELLDDDELTGD